MKKEELKDIALQRITYLFDLSRKTWKRDRELSKRYVEIALSIAKRTRVRLPWFIRRQFCHHCKTLFVFGENCRVRTRSKREPHLVVYCFSCKKYTRIPLRRGKKS